MFRNRKEAGERLADLLESRGVEADMVLGVPRGGLPVARVVADRLDLPLDIVVARKIGAPHNPELALGAVTSDGTHWLNEELVESIGVDDEYIESEREKESENARKKLERYREEVPDLAGKKVLIVDDGVATGATITACAKQVHESGARSVILAVPVAAPDSYERISEVVDEVVCVEVPSHFDAVGRFYEEFGQVSDEEAIEYLR